MVKLSSFGCRSSTGQLYCQDNTWDEATKANCDAEQDVWDPDHESTLETVGAVHDASNEVY